MNYINFLMLQNKFNQKGLKNKKINVLTKIKNSNLI